MLASSGQKNIAEELRSGSRSRKRSSQGW